MALAQGNKPKFEDDPAAAPAPQAATAPPAPAAAPAVAANVTQLPAVAAKVGLPVAAGGKFVDFFKQFANALPTMDFGTLPRLIGVNGAIFVKGNNTPDVSLGEKITIDIHSFHDEHVISPGSDKTEDKVHVKYSRDGGKTIEGTGQDVNEYLRNLVEVEGFKNAKCKRYVHLLGTLVSASKSNPLIGDIVDVSISPDGVKPWENHRMQTSAKISQEKLAPAGAERVTVTAVSKSGNGRNWVALVVGPAEELKQAA